MGHRKEYGELLEAIAKEADAIAMRYFRAVEMRGERKSDGTAVAQGGHKGGGMGGSKGGASGVAVGGLGEGKGDTRSCGAGRGGRAIDERREGAGGGSEDSGSTCWWRKAPSKRRWIGHRSPGTWGRWASSWKKRAGARRRLRASDRFMTAAC